MLKNAVASGLVSISKRWSGMVRRASPSCGNDCSYHQAECGTACSRATAFRAGLDTEHNTAEVVVVLDA